MPKKAEKNGTAPKKRMPRWKRNTDQYHDKDLLLLTFTTDKDLDDATALVWGGRLTGMPFDLDPNGPSLIVPKASVPYFVEAGISFTKNPPP